MRIRVRIREQLCLLVAVPSLLALAVLSVAVVSDRAQTRSQLLTGYGSGKNHIVTLLKSGRDPNRASRLRLKKYRSRTLAVTAELKASQIAQEVALYQALAQSVSSKNTLQSLVTAFNDGNDTIVLLIDLENELRDTLAGSIDNPILLQAVIFPRSDNLDPGHGAIANGTGEESLGKVPLPYKYQNGSQVYLGDPGPGYPRDLYPNFTWTTDKNDNMIHVSYAGLTLDYTSTLVLGPLYLNNQSALMSMTVAINNNTSGNDVLGWLTLIMDARLLYQVVNGPIGMDQSGEILIIGPKFPDNVFSESIEEQVASGNANVPVYMILPPNSNETVGNRHDLRAANPNLPFLMDTYPAVVDAYSQPVGSQLSTHNEEGKRVSVGYARVQSNIVDWVVIFEDSRGEVMSPINHLRNTIIACIFSVFGAIVIICFPLAHYAAKPIRALRNATENSIMVYEAEVPDSSSGSQSDPESLKNAEYVTANGILPEQLRRHKKPKMQRRRQFQIPEKVPERRHFIDDELTDLTSTFNEMSDELKVQYSRLEDRVSKRTAELEKSRDLARAADESKTLFIANVSHELRTPLNGIIGMCSVAMQEEEVYRIRQSLDIIYKSSDLLLHLLNDLLTFSRNSFGQQLAIEQGVFRLGDIGTQIVSIFEKQAREKDVGLKVVFQTHSNEARPEYYDAPEDAIHAKQDIGRMLKPMKTNVLARGPAETGPLRDMTLLGDKNRILQVLMNLVSNSLKFTPANGMIEVRIRCKGFAAATTPEHPGVDSATTVLESSEPSEKPPSTSQAPARELKFDFEVEDTGPGVPEHLHQEVFKPFVQGDLALSRKHGGTGLGLAICAQLASLMGGGIHLKSTVDIGSTFTFSISLGFTTEIAPSLAGSLGPDSRRGSLKSPSLTNSVDVLPTRSTRLPTGGDKTQPQSAKGSIYSGQEKPSPAQLDKPQIVGLSQPFLTDGVDEAKGKSGAESPRPRLSSQVSPTVIRNRLQSIQSNNGSLGERLTPQSQDDATNDDHTPQPYKEKPKESDVAPVTTEPAPGLAAKGQLDNETPKENGTAPKNPEITPAPSKAQPKDLKILVAEDNKVNQEVILRMLKLEKITDVTLAEDGLQAVEKIRSLSDDGHAYSLVFMDIQMPNMDGIEATKQIRELGFDRPIVALTAFDHETNREACSGAGMDDFMGKPLKRKMLREVLEKFSDAEGMKSEMPKLQEMNTI